VAPPEPPEIPLGLQHQDRIAYTWRLYDLYEQRDFQLFPKEQMPEHVSVQTKLAWSKSKGGKKGNIELSKTNDFTGASTFEAANGSASLSSGYLGDNFWRVSLDGSHWSSAEKFTVEAKFLTNADSRRKSREQNCIVCASRCTGICG
jgi:hypothetical protein